MEVKLADSEKCGLLDRQASSWFLIHEFDSTLLNFFPLNLSYLRLMSSKQTVTVVDHPIATETPVFIEFVKLKIIGLRHPPFRIKKL